jgi:hypothetical protein
MNNALIALNRQSSLARWAKHAAVILTLGTVICYGSYEPVTSLMESFGQKVCQTFISVSSPNLVKLPFS